jgi:hypothetical protein
MTTRFFKRAPWVGQISWPVLFFAVLSVPVFVGPWTWLPKPFTLVLPLRTSRAVQLKLYYTGESKFREDWTSVRYADSRSGFKVYRLPIDTTSVTKLRLHVGPAVILDLGQVTLARSAGASIPIAPSEIAVGPQPCGIEQRGDFIRLSTAPDSDGFDLELFNSKVPVISGRHLDEIVVMLQCGSLLGLLLALARQNRAVPNPVSGRTRTRRISGMASNSLF